jgi:4-nitrophenyl phosphatase
VVGSAYNAAYYIKHVMKLPEDKKVFVVGDKGLEDELNDMGVKFVGGHQEPNKPFSVQEIESYVPDPDVCAQLSMYKVFAMQL